MTVASPAASAGHSTRALAVRGVAAVNWPNLITTLRTTGAIVLGFIALVRVSWVLLLIAYATYWVGDIADGRLARWLDQETRLGAVFDILSDRACSTICIGALLVIRPEFAPALTVYFLQFMVVDALLTMSFLHWPWLKSPNYFYQVDRLIYRLNWSQPAKAANTSLLLAVLLVSYWAHWPFWIALVLALVQLVLKLWSAVRLLHLTTAQGARPAGPAQPDGKGVIRAALVAAGPSRPARPAGGPGAA